MSGSKVRENRLRRAAYRQGLMLSRNPRRDPHALDYGLYTVRRADEPVFTTADLDELEDWLMHPEKRPD
jgi:hypothetical protein